MQRARTARITIKQYTERGGVGDDRGRFALDARRRDLPRWLNTRIEKSHRPQRLRSIQPTKRVIKTPSIACCESDHVVCRPLHRQRRSADCRLHSRRTGGARSALAGTGGTQQQQQQLPQSGRMSFDDAMFCARATAPSQMTNGQCHARHRTTREISARVWSGRWREA